MFCAKKEGTISGQNREGNVESTKGLRRCRIHSGRMSHPLAATRGMVAHPLGGVDATSTRGSGCDIHSEWMLHPLGGVDATSTRGSGCYIHSVEWMRHPLGGVDATSTRWSGCDIHSEWMLHPLGGVDATSTRGVDATSTREWMRHPLGGVDATSTRGSGCNIHLGRECELNINSVHQRSKENTLPSSSIPKGGSVTTATMSSPRISLALLNPFKSRCDLLSILVL